MSDESLIIIDSTGSLLSRLNSQEKTTLKEMGYRLDESGIKIEMQQLPTIDLAIYKSKDDTKIIHHAYYDSKKPGEISKTSISDKRNERCYFLYKVHENNAKSDLLTTLKRFYNKADEDLKKYNKKLIHDKDSISNFIKVLFSWDKIPGADNGRLLDFLNESYGLDLDKTTQINKTDEGKTINATYDKKSISLDINYDNMEISLRINDVRTSKLVVNKENDKLNIYKGPNTELRTDISSILEKVKMCLDGNQSIKLAAKSIEIALLFLNRLYYKYNYNINYNFIIYNSDNPNLKGNINFIIDEVDGIRLCPTKEDIVRMLIEIKDDIGQKDRVGAKKKIESLLKMAGG